MPPTSFERFSGISTRGIPKYKLTTSLSHKYSAPKPFLPPDLGKSENFLVIISNDVGFFQVCVEARVPHELNNPPPRSHTAVPLLAHMRKHEVPMPAKRGMTEQDLTQAIHYDAHVLAMKETSFVRTDLAEETRTDHISLSPAR